MSIFKNIDALVFDFDGVLTNNLVYTDQNGLESVICNRADGLGFDLLRKLNKPTFILSSEENHVVTARAKKLNVPAFQGINNKSKALKKLTEKEGFDIQKILYVGNDLNDYQAMKLCGYSACPADSHPKIKEIASYILKTNGGNGIVRELLEEVLNIDFIDSLFMGSA